MTACKRSVVGIRPLSPHACLAKSGSLLLITAVAIPAAIMYRTGSSVQGEIKSLVSLAVESGSLLWIRNSFGKILIETNIIGVGLKSSTISKRSVMIGQKALCPEMEEVTSLCSMFQNSALRHKAFSNESIATILSDTMCLFESPFDKMRLTVGVSIEISNARMNGGLDIGVEQVEWSNRSVFRLE